MKSFLKIWLGVALIAIGIGIVVLIISFSAGVSFSDFTYDRMSFTSEDVPSYSLKESYTGVEGIDFNIQYGDIDIVRGDTFSIDAKHYSGDSIKSYVSNGTWYIEEDYNENSVKIFGFHVPVRYFYEWDKFSPHITITIPDNFQAAKFNLVVSAGDVSADEIVAEDGYLEVSAGRITVNKLDISGSSKYYVDAGQIKIEQANINDITVECGVGDVVIEGTVTGDNKVTCDIGSVKLNLDGDEEDYSYDVSVDIGNVEIEHDNYQSISGKVIDNKGADNKLSLNCDIGNITVDFN